GQRRLAGEIQVRAEETPPDLRLPDAGEDGTPLEVLVGPGVDGGRDGARGVRRRRRAARLGIRLEERERDLVAHVAERHPHRHADLDRVGRAAYDVGREAEVRLLDQLDQADRIRDLHAGHPALMVHRVADHGGAAADGLPAEVARLAARADRPRRVNVPAARPAARDLEAARAAGAPEALALGLERGQRQADLHRQPSMIMPPSIAIACPVMTRAPSTARKTLTRRGTRSGSPRRPPSGITCCIARSWMARCSSDMRARYASYMGVQIAGTIELTVMP